MKLRTIGKFLAGLLAFVILALISLPLLISAEMLKTKVAVELSKATGRTLTIEGAASLKLFPSIAIGLERVTFGNPEGGFASTRMFYADKLAAGVELMPLLNKQVVVTGVTLEGAEINLEETAGGQKNWEFAPRTAPAAAEASAPKQAKATAAPSIGEIVVKDSALTFRPATGKAVALQQINLTLNGVDGSAPLALEASAEYKGKQVSLSVDAKDARALLAGKGSTPVLLDVALPGGSLRFDGTASKAAPFNASGTLALEVASLPSLMEWATGKPAASTLPKAVTLQSTVAMNGKALALNDMKLKLDDMAISGALKADLTGAVPSLNGTLAFGVIDTARFSGDKAKAASTSGASGNAPAKGWSDARIDLSALKTVDAALGITFDGVKAGALALGKGTANVQLRGGNLQLAIPQLALYDGTARGNVQLSAGGLATEVTLSDIQVEPLLTALSGDARLKGKGQLVLKLRAGGNSQKAWVSSLNGAALASLKDGKLKGLNITEFLRNVKQGKLYADDTQTTDFASFSGSWNFANGVGINNDLNLTAPAMRMTGTGRIDLPARTLNYRLLPMLVASSKGQGATKEKPGLTVPLLVSGPWSALQIVPDIAGIVQEGLRDPEALKQNLKNIKEELKDFNSPSDIGKVLFGGGAKETTPAQAAPATSSVPADTSAPVQEKTDPKAQAIEHLFKAIGQ